MDYPANKSNLSPKELFLQELEQLSARFDALQPEMELTLRDPALGVEGYVVVWNTGISVGGPLERSGKGGTRITPNTSLDEIKMLARTMALKNAAAGLPLGGAKSGMRDDPDSPGFEKRYRRFVSLAKPTLFENGGIFGGFGLDIGTRPDHPRWACDELGSTRSFTGKPLEMGGTDYDNEGHAGLGVVIAAKTLLESDGVDLNKVRFAVQGGGAMGAAVIRYFSEFGATLHDISGPICGATYVFEQKPSKELLASLCSRNHHQTIELLTKGGYPKLPIEDVLYQDVDVLFPCAVQDVITERNAHKIRARYVVEGANGPCSPQARKLLHERGIKVIPDFIANPGGIIAAFVEMTSKLHTEGPADKKRRSQELVNEAKTLLTNKISENIKAMVELVNAHGVEPYQAGKYLALKKIFRHS